MSRQAFVFGAAFVGVYAEAFKFTGNNLKAFFQDTDLLEKPDSSNISKNT